MTSSSSEKMMGANTRTLLTSVAVCGPLFLTRFNLPPHGVFAAVVERFYLLPWAVLLVACARALDAFEVPALLRFKWLAPAALATAMALGTFNAVAELHRPTIAHYVHNTLALVEPNAVLVGGGDHRFGGFLYARLVLHERPDVAFVHPRLMGNAWYPPQAEALVGRPLPRTNSGPVLGKSIAPHRPTYLVDWMVDDARSGIPTYPIGPVMRVVTAPALLPMPEQLYAMNDAAFTRFTLEPSPPRSADSWSGDIFASYARPWQSLAGAFELRNPDRAEDCRQRAARFASP
jgi:hypothetical protein